MFKRRARLCALSMAASAACLAALEARGQQKAGVSAPTIEVLHVQGNVHMLAGAGANVVVQTGPLMTREPVVSLKFVVVGLLVARTVKGWVPTGDDAVVVSVSVDVCESCVGV